MFVRSQPRAPDEPPFDAAVGLVTALIGHWWISSGHGWIFPRRRIRDQVDTGKSLGITLVQIIATYERNNPCLRIIEELRTISLIAELCVRAPTQIQSTVFVT